MNNQYEFREGAIDCIEGRPARIGASDSYLSGYNLYYQLEQQRTMWSEENERYGDGKDTWEGIPDSSEKDFRIQKGLSKISGRNRDYI